MYLERLDEGKQRGGTVIVREVVDVGEHERRMTDPDAYRQPCRRCSHERPYAHDVRPRRPIGEAPVQVRRYLSTPARNRSGSPT